MELTPANIAYVTLASVAGIGRTRLARLLDVFGDAEKVLAAPFGELKRVATISRAAATAIASAKLETGVRMIRAAEDLGADVLVPSDASFPQALRDIPDGPTLLFALGKLQLLNQKSVAIVGSRDHSRYGVAACRHFSSGCARAGLVVISGMARGLDAVAHEACLDVGGATVGVLGNGLGVVYPAANRGLYDRVAEHGCLLTEFPPGDRPHAGSFPRRNRLISGLAAAVVVVEARKKSGALITADCALSQGKEVLAVPGQITSPGSSGCNRLIQQGAKPVLGLRDVLEEYGLSDGAAGARFPTNLSTSERLVLDVVYGDPEHIDQIASRVGQPQSELLAVLTSLEIRGLVSQEPGKMFRRVLLVAMHD